MSFPVIPPQQRRQQQIDPLAILAFKQRQQNVQAQQAMQQQEEQARQQDARRQQALELVNAGVPSRDAANVAGVDSTFIPVLKTVETKKKETAQAPGGLAIGNLAAARNVGGPGGKPHSVDELSRLQNFAKGPGELAQIQGLAQGRADILGERRTEGRAIRTEQRGLGSQFITLGNRKTGDLRTLAKNQPKQIQKLLDQGFIQVGAPQITGTAQELDLAPKTVATIEGALLKATSGLDRLHEIRRTFKPKFQQVGPRFTALTQRVKSKLGQPLSTQETQELAEFSTFKLHAITNLNLYIKDITGAQMSELEATRLRKGVPDPGDGLFDGDDPVTFDAKIDATILDLERYAARLHYAQKTGIIDVTKRDAEGNLAKSELNKLAGRLPVERMQGIMGKRHQEIAREIYDAKPGISMPEAEMEASALVDAEFGVR